MFIGDGLVGLAGHSIPKALHARRIVQLAVPRSGRLAVIRMLRAPVVVLLLLCRGALGDVFVIAVGFDFPLIVNDGLVLHRLGLHGLGLGGLGGWWGLATGGQNRSG
jgi:hypothetical protein